MQSFKQNISVSLTFVFVNFSSMFKSYSHLEVSKVKYNTKLFEILCHIFDVQCLVATIFIFKT